MASSGLPYQPASPRIVMSPEAVAEFQEELEKYSVDKGTIRISYGKIDPDLVRKIAQWCCNTGNHA